MRIALTIPLRVPRELPIRTTPVGPVVMPMKAVRARAAGEVVQRHPGRRITSPNARVELLIPATGSQG